MNNALSVLESSSIQMTNHKPLVELKQYPPFEVGKYFNIEIYYRGSLDDGQLGIKLLTSDLNYNALLDNFKIYNDQYGEYFFIGKSLIELSGLDIDSVFKAFCVSSVSNGVYRLRYHKEISVEVVQAEIVESPQDIHNRICDNFDIVEKTLYEICVDLKTIRDNKYYINLGYDNFEHYCKVCFNIGRSYASEYCSIAENLSRDFVCTCKQIGVRKLYILSRLTNNERTELLESTDIEHTPVKQLEQKAKEIKNNREVEQSIEIDDISLTSDVVAPTSTSNVLTEAPLTIEKVCWHDICYFSDGFQKNNSLPIFSLYQSKYQLTGNKTIISNDFYSYYEYIVKMKKLFGINLNALTSDEFNALDVVLSDLIEVSKRFNSCLHELKDYIRKYKNNKG